MTKKEKDVPILEKIESILQMFKDTDEQIDQLSFLYRETFDIRALEKGIDIYIENRKGEHLYDLQHR